MVKSFYYDTILYDEAALDYLVTKVGEDRVVAGSDYPFTIKQDRPAEFAEQVLGLPRETFTGNAMGLLGLEAKAPT
jgi:aminocarboxymuconate-semialdehyde decarboxylase